MREKNAVGLRRLHLVDSSRADPSTGRRELMVSVFYPAQPAATPAPLVRLVDHLFAPATDTTLATLAQKSALSPADLEHILSLTLPFAQPDSDLAVASDSALRPVLIYYPGGLSHRLSNAPLCAQLAADGFIVVCLDAPRDAPAVVYPDGRAVFGPPEPDEDYIWPRIADLHFLLDQLSVWNAAGPFAGQLDLSRIGAFGHSRGGYLALIAAVEDPRLRAVVNMDGFLWGRWSAAGTALDTFPDYFQAKARAHRTPVLRLRGDQGDAARARHGFEQESADLAGDFISLALHDWKHGDFATSPALCGAPEKLAATLHASPSPDRVKLLHTLLTGFFHDTLRTDTSPLVRFSPSLPGIDTHLRPALRT